jgi:hypothetical protein
VFATCSKTGLLLDRKMVCCFLIVKAEIRNSRMSIITYYNTRKMAARGILGQAMYEW